MRAFFVALINGMLLMNHRWQASSHRVQDVSRISCTPQIYVGAGLPAMGPVLPVQNYRLETR